MQTNKISIPETKILSSILKYLSNVLIFTKGNVEFNMEIESCHFRGNNNKKDCTITFRLYLYPDEINKISRLFRGKL